MGKMAVMFFMLLSTVTYGQDTTSIQLKPNQILHGGDIPPNISYFSGCSEDTIFMEYRFARDKKVVTYTQFGMDDVWVSYYKNGNIMQMGHFKRLIEELDDRLHWNSTKTKTGAWFYFSRDGKLQEVKLGKAREL